MRNLPVSAVHASINTFQTVKYPVGMADFRLTTVLTTLVLLHGFLDHVCWSCTFLGKWRPPILVNQILETGNILYGVVRETYPDEYYSSAYTVELEVYCILKGVTTPSVINITRGGNLLSNRIYFNVILTKCRI